MTGGPAVWGEGTVRDGGRGRPQLLPKPAIPAPAPKPTPPPVPWLPPCPAAAPSGAARAGRAPALTLHEHAGGVGDGALLAGSMAGVGAGAGALHDGDAQRPVPHLQRHRVHGTATKGQDTLRNTALRAGPVAGGGCHGGGDGRPLSSRAESRCSARPAAPRDPGRGWGRGGGGCITAGGNRWFAVLTCTVSPLWTARSLLFQMTTGWGLPTAVQVRLSASWSRTSTKAGGVSRKVGGAVKTNPDPHTPRSGSTGLGRPAHPVPDLRRRRGGQRRRVGSAGTIDGEVDPGAVLEVGVGAVAVEEEHAALVPALVLGAQEVDAQRGAFLDPHATCAARRCRHGRRCRLGGSRVPRSPAAPGRLPTPRSPPPRAQRLPRGSGADCPTWQRQGPPARPGHARAASASAGATGGWERPRDKSRGSHAVVAVGHTDV